MAPQRRLLKVSASTSAFEVEATPFSTGRARGCGDRKEDAEA